MKTAFVMIALSAACAASATAADRVGIVMCKGAQVTGTFSAVPGSAGAGNITYALRLKNVSNRACGVSGLPQGQLLGLHGGKLPTHVRAAVPGALTAVLVRLRPGQVARASARFSPDVPGTGEQTTGRCEPVSYHLRVVLPGGGTTTVKVLPRTSVCEHGRLLFSAYQHA